MPKKVYFGVKMAVFDDDDDDCRSLFFNENLYPAPLWDCVCR